MGRLRRSFMLGVLLVDLPVLVVGSAAGIRYGFADTLGAVIDWRLAHPWAGLPSAAAAAALIATSEPARRLRARRRTAGALR